MTHHGRTLGMTPRPRAGWHLAGLVAAALAAGGASAETDDLAAKRAALEELAGSWGLSARDCGQADKVDFRILRLDAQGLRVGDLTCTFGDIARHDSGLALIVEAACVSPTEEEATVFALAKIPDGQISVFEGQTGTNYLRCE